MVVKWIFEIQVFGCDNYWFCELWRRKEITFTSSRFSRMPLCLPVRYIPSGMRLTGNSQNFFGIFRETCQVYFLTAPYAEIDEKIQQLDALIDRNMRK